MFQASKSSHKFPTLLNSSSPHHSASSRLTPIEVEPASDLVLAAISFDFLRSKRLVLDMNILTSAHTQMCRIRATRMCDAMRFLTRARSGRQRSRPTPLILENLRRVVGLARAETSTSCSQARSISTTSSNTGPKSDTKEPTTVTVVR